MASYDEHGNFNSDKFKEEIKKYGGEVVSEDDKTIVVEVDGYQATVDKKTGEIIGEIGKAGVKPEFTVDQKLDSTAETVTLTVTVTNEVDKVDSITITDQVLGTRLEGIVNGKVGTFTTTLNGMYEVEVTATTNGLPRSNKKTVEVNLISVGFSMEYGRIEVVWIDKENNVIDKPLVPVLVDNEMTPVKWEGEGDNPTEQNVTKDDSSWYEYKAGTGKDDNLTSRWANVKYKESYFVWIPRYAYRITYYASEDSDQVTGYCDDRGIVDVKGNVQQSFEEAQITKVTNNGKNYIVHPAFKNGTDNNFKNGEWDEELSGIWVAKYEMSKCRFAN